MSTNIDQKVLDLFNLLQTKKKEVEAASEKPNWKTSLSIGFIQDSVATNINIATVTDLAKLVDLHSFLLIKSDYWDKSCKQLGIDVPFKWMGYTLNQWTFDFAARVKQINLSNKKKELAALEIRVNSLITVEQRRELELAELTKEISP